MKTRWLKRTALAVGFAAVCLTSVARHRFTAEQKEQDFEYLCKTLKENYPYFGVLQRQTGRDWLANHDRYLQMIRETTDDKSFVTAVQAIMHEIGCGHAYVIAPHMFDRMSGLYHQAAVTPGKENKIYRRWAAVYDRARPYYDYFKELYGIEPAGEEQSAANGDSGYDPSGNVSLAMLGDGKIGVLTINSFGNPSADSAWLMTCLDSVQGCEHLIIDLRKNSGGNDQYWTENIMPRLISRTYKWNGPSVVRRGSVSGTWYEKRFRSFKKVVSLPNLPAEVTSEDFAVIMDKRVVRPQGRSGFRGKVWLFVGPRVFSSSESFTAFTKATGWATIAGTRTGGDGIGSDPIPMMLPGSGLLVNFPAWGGLNPDGSFNFETRTAPDVAITAASNAEALANLVHYIDPTVEVSVTAGPHVVGVGPFENGAQDVDPAVTEIRFRFSEPMHGFSFGYGPLGPEAFPEIVRAGSGYCEDGLELTLAVKLKPETEYQIQVLEGLKLRNKKGVSVEGYQLSFKTRK